jgi:hypothetical protein
VYSHLASRLRAGETVDGRSTRNPMTPLIKSGQPVTLAPVDPATVGKGGVVLARAAGRCYPHKISLVQPGRVQNSNNQGHVNGRTSPDQVFGIVTAVAGRPPAHRLAQQSAAVGGDRQSGTGNVDRV